MFAAFAYGIGTELRVMRRRAGNLKRRATCLFDRLSGYRLLRRQFLQKTGLSLDLDHPRRFNEKIQWRKTRDRRPVLRVISNKSTARGWIAEQLGAEAMAEWTVPLLFEVSSPSDIPFDRLPEAYVIKGSHGSGFNTFVRPGRKLSRQEIVRRTRLHLATEYGLEYQEWAYWGGKRTLIGEPLLSNSDGTVPVDLKFHMFGDTCAMIHVNLYGHARTTWTPAIRYKYFYSADWRKLDIRGQESSEGDFARPTQLDDMLRIARRLAGQLDYLRVDFMLADDRAYLGELTLYQSSGMKRFDPDDVDFWLGDQWVLPQSAARSESRAVPA